MLKLTIAFMNFKIMMQSLLLTSLGVVENELELNPSTFSSCFVPPQCTYCMERYTSYSLNLL